MTWITFPNRRVTIVAIAIASLNAACYPANAQRKEETISIQRNGKTVSIYVPSCANTCGIIGTFDLKSSSGVPEVDTRGFAGTMIGQGGDYTLNPTLRKAVLSVGEFVQREEVAHRFHGIFLNSTIYGMLLDRRFGEVFGGTITAGKFASMALLSSVTPTECGAGSFPFRRNLSWDLSRPFTDCHIQLAKRIYEANFDEPAGATRGVSQQRARPGVTVLKPVAAHSALRRALQDACIDPDEAATRYLSYALTGTGLSSGPVHVEMGELPGAVNLHLRLDLANAVFDRRSIQSQGRAHGIHVYGAGHVGNTHWQRYSLF
jgi:hypothetical protein